MERGLFDFVNDIILRQQELQGARLMAVDPRTHHPCHFHEHAIGAECDSGARKDERSARLRAQRARRQSNKFKHEKYEQDDEEVFGSGSVKPAGGAKIKEEVDHWWAGKMTSDFFRTWSSN